MRAENINISLLERIASTSGETLFFKFPKLNEWMNGDQLPTVKQLADFARAVHIPFGYFFLKTTPALSTGIPLFRSKSSSPTLEYSEELRDTIKMVQSRQDWLRDYLISEGYEKLSFVGTATEQTPPEAIANSIKAVLGLDDLWARQAVNWEQALAFLIKKTEEAGIFVTINGIIGNNTHRPLDPEEFRGFVLSDEYAPFIFINGKDFTAAKTFTLAHELAHLWLGKSAAFDLEYLEPSTNGFETLCDKVAAEFLVPAAVLRSEANKLDDVSENIKELSRTFKVSQIVIARRLLDLQLITKKAFFNFYNDYLESWQQSQQRKSGGGDFYNNQPFRIGRAFFSQVDKATRQGKLLYTDAYKLTGLHGKTYHHFEQDFNK